MYIHVVYYGLGRAFNVPTLIDIPKRVRFIDVAGGFDHTIFLAENGDVYSMGMGTYVTWSCIISQIDISQSKMDWLVRNRRGQLGHNDLEDCDNPKIIDALAGIKVTQISAAGWHTAVVTDQVNRYFLLADIFGTCMVVTIFNRRSTKLLFRKNNEIKLYEQSINIFRTNETDEHAYSDEHIFKL